MYQKIKHQIAHLLIRTKQKLPRRFSTHKALVLSVLFHLMVGAAMATFWAGTIYIEPAPQDRTIEFDLTPTRNVQKTNQNIAKSQPQKTESRAAISKQKGTAASGKASREKAIMASLAGLSQLKAAFNFQKQGVAADSAAFGPVQKSAAGADLKAIIQKYKSAQGSGGVSVGVGGACVATPKHN